MVLIIVFWSVAQVDRKKYETHLVQLVLQFNKTAISVYTYKPLDLHHSDMDKYNMDKVVQK